MDVIEAYVLFNYFNEHSMNIYGKTNYSPKGSVSNVRGLLMYSRSGNVKTNYEKNSNFEYFKYVI